MYLAISDGSIVTKRSTLHFLDYCTNGHLPALLVEYSATEKKLSWPITFYWC